MPFLKEHFNQAKRFNRRAFCAYCHDRIWGLGRQGFKCTQCKLLIHKKCHKLLKVVCDAHVISSMPSHPRQPSSLGSGGAIGGNGEEFRQHEPKVPIEDVHPSDENAQVVQKSESKMVSIADFELIRVIGRGSYAKVLMVELKKTKRIYAMKVIKKELVTDDEDIDWVQTEKHVFETASNHPFLVGLHSCFQTPSR